MLRTQISLKPLVEWSLHNMAPFNFITILENIKLDLKTKHMLRHVSAATFKSAV